MRKFKIRKPLIDYSQFVCVTDDEGFAQIETAIDMGLHVEHFSFESHESIERAVALDAIENDIDDLDVYMAEWNEIKNTKRAFMGPGASYGD